MLVFNASPLIVLAKAGLIDPIMTLADRVVIPRPVALEIAGFNHPADAACAWIGTPAAQSFIAEPPVTSEFVAAWGLGAGESAVISLVEFLPGSIAVLDDLVARRCAGALRLQVVGTLGLLLMAKKAAVIPAVSGPLNDIVSAGLFIAPKHLSAILEQVGEAP